MYPCAVCFNQIERVQAQHIILLLLCIALCQAMSSCCISVMYDPNALLRHTTAHTLLTLLETPSAVFSFHLSNSYLSLPLSSLSVLPSLTLVLSFQHPLYLSALLYPSLYFVFMNIPTALFSSKIIQYCTQLTVKVVPASAYDILAVSMPAKTLDAQYILLLGVK